MIKIQLIAKAAFLVAFYTAATVVTGAVVGGLIFSLCGAVTHGHVEFMDRLRYGFSIGGRYAGVWAGGMGIVLAVRRLYCDEAKRERGPKE